MHKARSGLLISTLGKLSWYCVTSLITLVLLMSKMDLSVLEEKYYFIMLVLTFSSKLDWGAYIFSIAKTTSKNIGALIRSMQFLSPEVALYVCKSTIYDHVWNAVVTSGLVPLVARQICRTVGPSLAASLEPFGSSSKCGQLKPFL